MQRTTSREAPVLRETFLLEWPQRDSRGGQWDSWINQRAFSTHHLCWHKRSKQGSTKGLPPQAPIPWHQLDHVPVSAASRKLKQSHGSISKRNPHAYIQIDFTVNNHCRPPAAGSTHHSTLPPPALARAQLKWFSQLL